MATVLGLVLGLGPLLLAGCSWFGGDSKPAATASTMSAEEVAQHCADPKWREENLGLWYSVCRKPLRW